MEEIKQKLRGQKLRERDSLTKFEIESKSRKIKKSLLALSEFKKAHVIMFYVSCGTEVDTRGIITEALKMRKKVVVPKVLENNKLAAYEIKDFNKDLSRGSFGILEPKHSKRRPILKNKIELVIVPGVCFDLEKGGRIGFGKGYYDRFLSDIKHAQFIGLAFENQLAETIPCNTNDVCMNKIVSEKRVIDFGQ